MTVRKYLQIVLDGMAKGLFATLIVGVILKQFAVFFDMPLLTNIGQTAQYLTGAGIGAGVAISRKAGYFTTLSAMVVGVIGSGAFIIVDSTFKSAEPVGALIAALVVVEIGKLLEGKTKFDLLILPIILLTIGGIVGTIISPPISQFMSSIGVFVNTLTELNPIPMGILLGIVVGTILTLPISSAAICISIGISGLAAGAAVAGCSAQMISYAVISYKDNGISGFFSQAIGTSMLQVPNIIKNPLICIPATIASGICGLIATSVFHMETNSVGAGMGTSGLVGQFTTLNVMGPESLPYIIILHFITPAVVSYIVYKIMLKKELIKPLDMKI